MKDTHHPIRHPRSHRGGGPNVLGRRGSARHDDHFGRGQNTVLDWSDPTSLPPKPRRSLQSKKTFLLMFCPRVSPDSERNRRRKKVNRVKTVRITLFNFVFSNFFTQGSTYGIHSQALATTTSANVTAQKRPNRAGATPLFCGRSAQKFRGVTPALAGNSRRHSARLQSIPRICQTECLTFVRT
jgi:hypothetical protein